MAVSYSATVHDSDAPRCRFPLPHTVEDTCCSTEDSDTDTRRSRRRSSSQSWPRWEGTLICIFGNLWAVFICWEVWVPSPGMLEATVAKEHKLKKKRKNTNWRRVWSGQLGAGLGPGQAMVGEKQLPTWWGQRWLGRARAWAEPRTCRLHSEKRPFSGPQFLHLSSYMQGQTDQEGVLTLPLASSDVAHRGRILLSDL